MARRYRPTLPPTTRAVAALVCAASGTSILLAVVWPRLGRLGDIVLLGTVARALVIGLVLSWVIDKTALAHARLASAAAVLTTILAIVGAHYQTHREQRTERIAEAEELRLQSTGYGRDIEDIDREFEQTVESLTFANYLRTYFGVRHDSRDTKRDAAANKGGPIFGIGLYAIELLVAMLASTYFPTGLARMPACSICGRWYREGETKKAAHGVSSEFVAAMKRNESSEAVGLLRAPDTAEFVGLALNTCPSHCQAAEPVLRVRDITRGRGGDLVARHVADLVLSNEEVAALEEWT